MTLIKFNESDVNRTKIEANSRIAVVINRPIHANDFYQLGIRVGKLKSLHTRNQFTLCNERFVYSKVVGEEVIYIRVSSAESCSIVSLYGCSINPFSWFPIGWLHLVTILWIFGFHLLWVMQTFSVWLPMCNGSSPKILWNFH